MTSSIKISGVSKNVFHAKCLQNRPNFHRVEDFIVVYACQIYKYVPKACFLNWLVDVSLFMSRFVIILGSSLQVAQKTQWLNGDIATILVHYNYLSVQGFLFRSYIYLTKRRLPFLPPFILRIFAIIRPSPKVVLFFICFNAFHSSALAIPGILF